MTVWIINHYATDVFFDHGGRHYEFAKYLIRSGYKVVILCASSSHNSNDNLINNKDLYFEDECDGIPFVFVRARNYTGNGKQRILNMLDYYKNVQKVAKHLEKPDAIIGSSVHPLACVAGIKLSKRFSCKNIVEVRDLWPESIVAYGLKKKNNPIISVLYRLEKWIYTKAGSIIFTMEGGKDYIIEKGWDTDHGGSIDMKKVYHINNGVDLELFDYNKEHFTLVDSDLCNSDYFNVIYTGSIRKANRVDQIIDTAVIIKERGFDRIRFLVFGDGDERTELENRAKQLKLDNVIFKGYIKKDSIPYILSYSNANFMDYFNPDIAKYGISSNKMFEYFAAGKPILMNHCGKYNPVEQFDVGVLHNGTAEDIANKIIYLYSMSDEDYKNLCIRTQQVAKQYDFQYLTQQLVNIISAVER